METKEEDEEEVVVGAGERKDDEVGPLKIKIKKMI